MDDDIVSLEFSEGVNAYWSGELPERWGDRFARAKSPFLTGWYMASMWETEAGFLTDADGDPLQDEGY